MSQDLDPVNGRLIGFGSVRGSIILEVEAAERALSHVGLSRMAIGEASHAGILEGLEV